MSILHLISCQIFNLNKDMINLTIMSFISLFHLNIKVISNNFKEKYQKKPKKHVFYLIYLQSIKPSIEA
jgi:hypothetical protein